MTPLLLAWSQGDATALDKLIPLVYELHRLAQRYLRRERPDHTLPSKALVNEVHLRLIDQDRASWQNRAQFLAVCAQLMRRALVDYARRRHYVKRGAGRPKSYGKKRRRSPLRGRRIWWPWMKRCCVWKPSTLGKAGSWNCGSLGD